VRVRLLGTGGAANEARHQACLLVGRGDGSDEGPFNGPVELAEDLGIVDL
jgi:hypothetical protein